MGLGPTIWNSNLVLQTLEKLRMGIPGTDLSCFHVGDIELKAADILYQLTPEEIEEFHKCSHDIVYFVEQYCRFLTDAGRKVVKLRPFQKTILRALAEEIYSEKLEEFLPEIRNLIMMQSRQSGKCLFDGLITLQWPNGNIYKIPINLFYYMQKKNLTFLENIKVKLMMLNIVIEKDVFLTSMHGYINIKWKRIWKLKI